MPEEEDSGQIIRLETARRKSMSMRSLTQLCPRYPQLDHAQIRGKAGDRFRKRKYIQA